MTHEPFLLPGIPSVKPLVLSSVDMTVVWHSHCPDLPSFLSMTLPTVLPPRLSIGWSEGSYLFPSA